VITVIFPSLAGTAVRVFPPTGSSLRRRQPFSFLSFLVVQKQSQKRHLILISGFIHDVGSFIDEHPGGPHLLIKMIGKDATTAFFGGVYDHSNAAHNVSSCFSSLLLFSVPFAHICQRSTHHRRYIAHISTPYLYIRMLTLSIPVTRDETRGRSSRRYPPWVGRQDYSA